VVKLTLAMPRAPSRLNSETCEPLLAATRVVRREKARVVDEEVRIVKNGVSCPSRGYAVVQLEEVVDGWTRRQALHRSPCRPDRHEPWRIGVKAPRRAGKSASEGRRHTIGHDKRFAPAGRVLGGDNCERQPQEDGEVTRHGEQHRIFVT
jgi:hypothetical protein